MRKSLLFIALSSLMLTACGQQVRLTQPQASVDKRGHMFYGPDGARQQSNDGYNPPRLATYHPDPYEPDFRAREGQVNIQTPGIDRTASYSPDYLQPEPYANQTQVHPVDVHDLAPIQSRDIAAPQAQWSQPQRSVQSFANRSDFIPPVEADVITGYGSQENGMVNDGINYLIPAGEPVYASSDGTVAYVGDELKSYGNMVIIKHADGYNTSYAHLSRAILEKGDAVRQGQIIGYVGQSGNVSKPQLHFAIRRGSDPVDPNSVLNKQLAAN